MITTITLNVSLDKTYYINDEINENAISRVSKVINTAGGRGLNVARMIKKYDEKVLATGLVGGFNGDYIKSLLEEDGIRYSFTKVKSETRSCIKIIDKNNISKEYIELGGYISTNEIEDFIDNFDTLCEFSDIVTISGSIPVNVSIDIYAKLIKMCKKKKKKVLIDTTGSPLKEAIVAKPTLIKLNEQEFNTLLNSTDNIKDGLTYIQKEGIEYIILSTNTGIYLQANNNTYFIEIDNYNEKQHTSDILTASLAVGFKKKKDILDNFKNAVACAMISQNIYNIDEINLFDANQIVNSLQIIKLD